MAVQADEQKAMGPSPERLLLLSAFRALPEFSASHSLPFATMDAICLIKKNFLD
jgi:hypothetical protein